MFNRDWHIENLRRSGVPESLIDDVAITGESDSPRMRNREPDAMTDVEELVVENNTDGKTWMDNKDRYEEDDPQ